MSSTVDLANMKKVAAESLAFSEVYMGAREHNLAYALHEYSNGRSIHTEMMEDVLGQVYAGFAKAAEKAGSPIFAQIWHDAQKLQLMIESVPGETDTPEYEAWEASVEELEERFFNAGGTQKYRELILRFTIPSAEERDLLLEQHRPADEKRLREWKSRLSRSRPDACAPFNSGDRVFHKKFGYGEVQYVETDSLMIAFDKAGPRKMAPAFIVAEEDAGDEPA